MSVHKKINFVLKTCVIAHFVAFTLLNINYIETYSLKIFSIPEFKMAAKTLKNLIFPQNLCDISICCFYDTADLSCLNICFKITFNPRIQDGGLRRSALQYKKNQLCLAKLCDSAFFRLRTTIFEPVVLNYFYSQNARWRPILVCKLCHIQVLPIQYCLTK